MSKLLVENRQVVIPGDILAEGMDYLPAAGSFREDDKIIASQVGLVNIGGRLIRIIPLKGKYIPKKDDTVIGIVKDTTYSSWFIDVGYAYEGSLSLKDATSDYIERGANLSDFYAVGDYVIIKITNVTHDKSIDLTMVGPGLRKIRGGKVVTITPYKIPRVVGKAGSMITMIKEHTGCSIFAGQNGRIWIRGQTPEAELLASKAIELIEEESHIPGLTDRIKKFLEENKVELVKEFKEEAKE
jgi:exosome complex component RRP4